MFFNGVRLPDELRIALDEDQLVVFAGAGISMPPPSNLPLFNGLVSQISGGATVEAGLEDRCLGKLARERETNVHAAAVNIVYGEHTAPTVLHREILRLFGSAEKVRLVTTNFDDHFSTTARKLFRKDRLREFCAPALPLGDNFSGLVYLHGSARIDPEKLVLTDKDFGAAYLTRGWARDFLVSLFSRYKVLFVGYSHSDVTTTYLARGLEPSEIGQRWAMVSSDMKMDARENWEHLEISVVEYPIDPTNEENTHQALTGFFSQWADHRKENVFARAKRIKAIARSLPPESESDSAYLHYCLSHPRLAGEFCKAIRHAAWVGWMHERGYFDAFFNDTTPNAMTVESQSVLARWLCSDVRQRFPDVLLNIIREHHQRLTLEFSRILAHHLWVDQSNKPDKRFATWVSVLLSQGKDVVPDDIWGYLLDECRLPEHAGVALSLFEFLTTPEIRIEEGWDWSSLIAKDGNTKKQRKTKVDFSIGWLHESRHQLNETWTKVFEPHLPEIADSLSQIIVKQFTHAYLLLRGVGKKYEQFDYLSQTRSSIASHEQNDFPLDECISCLIDILRDIFDYWIKNDPSRARLQAEAWWSTKLPLLMRFAAYARSQDPQYNPDERIEWVLANNLVFRSGMKKEVFDILASAYPRASQRIRKRLLRRIDRGYRGPGAKNLDAGTLAYEKFNVLIWLRRSDSNCPLVASAISAIQAIYPNFDERDYPEFDSWHGKARHVDPTEGFDFDRILSAPPEDFVEKLVQVSKGLPYRDLWDHLQCLPRLFKENKEWGLGFTEALSLQTVSDDKIWDGVFEGWRDAVETSSDWSWILHAIEKLPREAAIFSGVAHLISGGFRKHHAEWEENIIDLAASLMEQAWDLCRNEKESADDSYGDWLTAAINHVGGWIGEFWVHYCSHLRQRAGENWQGIPMSLKSKIVEAVHGKNRIKVYARIALTPWIGFFFAWDREFCVEHLLPLLDWKRDPIVAQQSWSVLLNYKRGTSVELETKLIPFYRQCAEQMTKMLKDATEKSGQFNEKSLQNLGHHLAVLAIHVIPDPVNSGFFQDFLPLLSEEVRGSLAIGMGNQLEGLDDAKCQNLWDTWLKRYLDLRLVGIPVALSTAETKRMLKWCLYLGPAFPEAVERITQMPQEAAFTYGILKDLEESSLVDQSPLAACRLTISALRAEDYPHLHPSLITLHEKFKKTICRTPEFSEYEELLYLRGWKKSG